MHIQKDFIQIKPILWMTKNSPQASKHATYADNKNYLVLVMVVNDALGGKLWRGA